MEPRLILFYAIFGLLVTVSQLASSANILAYVALGGYSHRLSMWPFIVQLAESGHNVTFVSNRKNKSPHPQVRDYVPKLWASRLDDSVDAVNFYELRKQSRLLQVWTDLTTFGIQACEAVYEDEEFLEWLRTAPKFDLVIVDTMMNECVYGIARHLWKSKIIVYSTANVMGWFQDSYGMPDETSSFTDPILSFQLGPEMNFLQRFANAMSPLVWKFWREWWYLPKLEQISKEGLETVLRRKIPDEEFPSFIEIEKSDVKLVMVSSHNSMSFPKALPRNMVEVGGVTMPNNAGKEPLPKELEEFIGNAEAFIYVSLGSNVEFSQIDPNIREEFIQTLESMPEVKFIWKSDIDLDPGMKERLKHVKVVTWAPQSSLLAHPKLQCFVTHAGLGSTTEAIYFGVPVVLFPDMNAAWVVARGGGVIMEILEVTKEKFRKAIQKVSSDPKYRKSMQNLQKQFNDRPLLPVQTAQWWAEYVLRHDDTNDFLQPASVHQSWWVKRQIDVWLVFSLLLLTMLSVPFLILYKIVKCVLFSSKKRSSVIGTGRNAKKDRKKKNN